MIVKVFMWAKKCNEIKKLEAVEMFQKDKLLIKKVTQKILSAFDNP